MYNDDAFDSNVIDGMASLLDHDAGTAIRNFRLLDKNSRTSQAASYNEKMMFLESIDNFMDFLVK